MQYSSKDYELLGKQVAAGRYVTRSTCILALILAFLVGVAVGRYLLPDVSGMMPGAQGQKRPLGEKSSAAAIGAPDKNLFASILQHEEEVRQNPKNAEAWEHLGNLYFDAKEPGKAVNAYTKALELNPNNTSVLVDRGVMYRELRQFDLALDSFKKALTLDPKHEFALFNSGIVLYHDLNRKEEALEAWRALVKINPAAKAPSGELVSDMLKSQ